MGVRVGQYVVIESLRMVPQHREVRDRIVHVTADAPNGDFLGYFVALNESVSFTSGEVERVADNEEVASLLA